MLTNSDSELLELLRTKVTSRGRAGDWVVGVSNEAAWRLFVEHRANRRADEWLVERATDLQAASLIEEHLGHLGVRIAPAATGGSEVFAYHLAEAQPAW